MSAAECDREFGPRALFVYEWSPGASGTECSSCSSPSLALVSVIEHRPCRVSGHCEMLHCLDHCCGAMLAARREPNGNHAHNLCHRCLLKLAGDQDMTWHDRSLQTPRHRLRNMSPPNR